MALCALLLCTMLSSSMSLKMLTSVTSLAPQNNRMNPISYKRGLYQQKRLWASANAIVQGPSQVQPPQLQHQLLTIVKSPLTFALSLLSPTIAGGILSGGLHAITGPDHLAALIPPSVGHPWYHGMRLGALWGFGHGASAIFLGLCAFFLKGQMSTKFNFLQQLSTVAESTVGLSLILIGCIGIKENMDTEAEIVNWQKQQDPIIGEGNGISTDVAIPSSSGALKSAKAIVANGVLHGFSWDGAPSLAPALAMTSWRSALSFLVAYCLGTMATMAITAGAVGEGSLRLGKAVNNPKLPRNLSFISSVVAIVIGIFWMVKSII